MTNCTFFGHRDCSETVKPKLRETLVEPITSYDVDMFYAGHVLQEMNLEEVETYESVVAKNVDLPHSVNTGFGELSDLVYSTPSAPPIFIPCLIKHISPFVNIHGDESIEELYVLAKTAFFIMSQQ